jgi:3-methyladenine DNA glycosylase AlkD
MPIDPKAATEEISSALRSGGDRDRAGIEKRYLKSDLDHFGTSVPVTRKVIRSYLRDTPQISRRDLLRIVQELWDRRVHECRMAAVELLSQRGDLLDLRDARLVEKLIRESKTWALVDVLAITVAGDLLVRFSEMNEVLEEWATDRDFWIRRSALLALLKPLRAGEGDFARFNRYADPMLAETEFFIRKAIGWVLRETSKKQPGLVYEWLAPRAARASGVTIREAVKYLSDEQAQRIITAHKRAR